MAFKLTNKQEIENAVTTDQDKKVVVASKSDSIEKDYKAGIVNLRFLANKYNKTLEEVAKIVIN